MANFYIKIFLELNLPDNTEKKVDLVKSGLPQGTYIVKVSTGSYREIQSINMIQ